MIYHDKRRTLAHSVKTSDITEITRPTVQTNKFRLFSSLCKLMLSRMMKNDMTLLYFAFLGLKTLL